MRRCRRKGRWRGRALATVVLMDGVGGNRVDVALAFRRVYGDDEEAHQDALAQRGWRRSRSRRTRCARPCDAWPGRPCRRDLSAGPVVCTHLLECSAEGAVAFV